MPWIESLDWTSLNALRRYPLRQGASAQSADGLFSLPDSLIVDFSLTATSDVTRRFYIARILNRLSSIILEVRDNFTEVVGTVEFLDSRNGSFSLTGDVKITAPRQSALWRSTCRSATRSRSTSLRSSAAPSDRRPYRAV